MRKKAMLINLRVQIVAGSAEIRVYWDNDRYQAVRLADLDAESLRKSLDELRAILSSEIISGHI